MKQLGELRNRAGKIPDAKTSSKAEIAAGETSFSVGSALEAVLRVDQPSPDREADQPGGIVNIQLSHEVIPMAVYGAKADIESVRDLTAVQSFSNTTKGSGFLVYSVENLMLNLS